MGDIPPYLSNFVNFIDAYGYVPEFDAGQNRKIFNSFFMEMVQKLPKVEAPADPYMFNSHMDLFARLMDQAKDAYAKAYLAALKKRESLAVKK
jgi:hypothetical protein